MLRSNEAMSKHSSLVYLESGDDEVYLSGYEFVADD